MGLPQLRRLADIYEQSRAIHIEPIGERQPVSRRNGLDLLKAGIGCGKNPVKPSPTRGEVVGAVRRFHSDRPYKCLLAITAPAQSIAALAYAKRQWRISQYFRCTMMLTLQTWSTVRIR